MSRWDFEGLGHLVQAIDHLQRVPERVAPAVAQGVHELIAGEFATGTDPYGDPWEPLSEAYLARRPDRGHPPLTDTGEMRDSVMVTTYPNGASSVAIDVRIADCRPFGGVPAPHQDGWTGAFGSGPARPMVPDHGLPGSWDAMFREVIRAQIISDMKGAP